MITKREYQVAELISWGASDKEVAQELDISHTTARTHRKNILGKIEGHNTADLTRWFFSRQKGSLGMNPRQVFHITVFLLALFLISEFGEQVDMIRVRRVRTVRTSLSRARRRDDTFYTNEKVA